MNTQAIDAFLGAVAEQDLKGALDVLNAQPSLPTESLHVAAAVGSAKDATRLIDEDRARLAEKRGDFGGEPLLYLCHSPFHGESAARDEGLLETARVLLDAGANPNTTDAKYNVPALFAVTGQRSVPRIATLLLDAGANPTDGESMFHAAERYHVDAMDLLLARGCDINHVGDWGNTPLTFLLRWYPLALAETPARGFEWLLEHGANPNVVCGRERETALHVAARRGQDASIVRALLRHGADVHATRGDGATAWMLARRGGFDEAAALLEEAGAKTAPPGPLDRLLRACAQGEVAEAARLAAPEHLAAINEMDDARTTLLHEAAFHGRANQVRALIAAGADLTIRDRQHNATPLGWAEFAAEVSPDPDGDYPSTIAALKAAGAP